MTTNQQITPTYWKPMQHSMTRRQALNNYHVGHKAYMVTLKIEGMTKLLGSINAACAACDQQQAGVSVALSPLGQAMRTAWLTLPQRFHNITVVDAPGEYAIMPEHFHGIIYVTGYMQEHLSDIITLFKARVAMAYRQQMIAGTTQPVGTAVQWLQAYHAQPATQQQAMQQWVDKQMALLHSATGRRTQQQQCPPPYKVTASGQHSKVGFLFATGYTDSVLLDNDNLDGHRQYIRDNAYNRWLRTASSLRPNRNGIDTQVTFGALVGYLRRECSPCNITTEKLQQLQQALLISATNSRIECYSYGNRGLLNGNLLPVVCHRKDERQFATQKARCLQAAKGGAVMVSACISQKEREIFTAIQEAGYPVIRIEDNGFPEIYHPSAQRTQMCAEDKLLILTPWQYHYRAKDDAVYVAYCKTMNCIAQAICRTRDDWWIS